MTDPALVLLSGGQDSTTCLAWALERYPHVETIGFAYGQRHAVELECRAPLRDTLATLWPGRLGSDHTIDLTATIGGLGATALTSQTAIAMTEEGLPSTFIPGRNLLFLACAAALAYRRGLRRIVAGMCETDYSGYPDCRDDTVKAMQLALNLGMRRRFVLETPLMWRDKAASWALAEALGGTQLVELIRTGTHSCYVGDRSHLHDWGYGCGGCPACNLRAAGWQRWRAAPGFNRRITRGRSVMKLSALAVALTASLIALPAAAQRGTVLQARTAGELAELCAASPKDPLGEAKINFCHGFAQGAISTELRHADGKKPFCFPSPSPSRTATMNEFVGWVRSMPDHRTPPAVEGLFQFLGGRFPCK